MLRRLKNKLHKIEISIQMRLIAVFLIMTVVLFGVNVYIYSNLDEMMLRIEQVYASNTELNELQNILTLVQDDMTEYLNLRQTDSMENFYRDVTEYDKLVEGLNNQITDDELLLLEKNIRNLSERYRKVSELAIKYRRGYDVEKYKENYEEATELCTYIRDYIYCLNNKQFYHNSQNYHVLMNTMHRVETLNQMMFVLTGMLTIVLIIWMTQGIIQPLRKLAETANEVAGGNLEVARIEVYANDEVGVVTKAFNKMVLSIQEYIKRLRQSMETERQMQEKELRMEAHLKDAQLKYLQAQINPHFLFNTLNAGAQLAMMEDAERTYEYVQNVADFFRYSVKKDYGSVSLYEEIELVDNYIYIINVRFSGEVHYSKQIDKRLVNASIPAMVLQPIVENCVNHGIRGIDREGKILLSVYRDNNDICVSVKDNGIGMSQDKIHQILSGSVQVSADNKDSNGIGLDNVINRLALFYGKEDILQIQSDGINQGTEFIIRIPMQ